MANPFFNDGVGGVPVSMPGTGRIYGLRLVNVSGATAFLQVFGRAAAGVSMGNTKPDFTVRLGANESLVWPMPENPIELAPPGLPNVVGPNQPGMSCAGTTTATGSSGANISVSALVA